ncbi:MAG TPA: thioredoxin domain-containing protein [Chloroflexota bacterium]|nr:thioredoxin domain-containing protein [Chloroflexota bacterium]
MSQNPRNGDAGKRTAAGPGMNVIAAVAVVAVIVVVGLIWLAQAEPAAAPSTVAASGKTRGVMAAPVEVEVWSDFQCSHCRNFALGVGREIESTLVAEGNARVTFRQFPFLGLESLYAAQASECAVEQDLFWPYHDRLFSAQAGVNTGVYRSENLERYATEVGLNTGAFSACLESGRTNARVEAEAMAGQQKGVRATPTIFVGDQKIEGVPSYAELAALIEDAHRAKTGQGRAAGSGDAAP